MLAPKTLLMSWHKKSRGENVGGCLICSQAAHTNQEKRPLKRQIKRDDRMHKKYNIIVMIEQAKN